MQAKGWFKFYRQTWKNPVCTKDSDHFLVWLWLLSNATFEDGEKAVFQGEVIELQKGQIVTTVKEMEKELGINRSKIDRILKCFKSEKQIEKQTSNKNTLITVLNWEKYQGCEKQIEKQVRNKRETNEKPSYYNKEIKNKRTKEEQNNEALIFETEKHQKEIAKAVSAWNELQKFGIKPISRLGTSTTRYKSLNARISEYGISNVITAIENIKTSNFLQGNSSNGWTITFDWFIKPNNFPKVLDGNYNNSRNFQKQSTSDSRDEQFRKLMQQIHEDEEDST